MPLLFVVCALAVWRIGNLFAHERGMFGVATRFRSLFGVAHEFDGTPSLDRESGEVLLNPLDTLEDLRHELAQGITCVWCNSLWIAPFVALALAEGLASWLLYTLALSAVACLLDKWEG